MKILLVIPCLRERARLPKFLPKLLECLRGESAAVDILIVDDGSGPAEQAWLESYLAELRPASPNVLPPLLLKSNQGKGGAVYHGWHTATAEHTHVGFVDADGAVPPGETTRICVLASRSPDRAIYAVRTGTDDTTVERAPGRALAGRFFRLLVEFLFGFPVPETQCGCKIIPAAAWQSLSASLTERRFCFDIDLTWHLLHQGTAIRAVPVDWKEISGGQLRASSVLAMILSLVKLRRKLGAWQPADSEERPGPA